MTEPVREFTPEELEQARTQAAAAQAAPVGTSLSGDASGASAYETDIAALKAAVARQQALIEQLIAERTSTFAPELVSTAESLRNLIADHFDRTSHTADGSALRRLGDDLVDAAANAVESGDTGIVRDISAKIERALTAAHPGPGDHSYFRQAVEFARDHVPFAADRAHAPKAVTAVAVGSSQPPVKVLSGNVTG